VGKDALGTMILMDHRYSFIMELVFGFFMACGGVGFVHLRSGLGLPRSFCCPQNKTKQNKQTKKKKKTFDSRWPANRA
jgi:hypothetical protein